MRRPFLCRHGWHKWRFVEMSDTRMVDAGPHYGWICDLHEACDRVGCGLHRILRGASLPKRVKVFTEPKPFVPGKAVQEVLNG
jgi:hypothetical protein